MMHSPKFYFFSFALAALLLAVGCDEVEERLSWSPDGNRAAMRVGDGLCLVDTNGNISAPLATNVEWAAWLPDSRGLVLLRNLTVTKWQDAAQLLPREETLAVQTLAKALPDLLKAGLAAADGDPSALSQKMFEQLKPETAGVLPPAILYVLDTQPAALEPVFKACKDRKRLEQDLSNARTTMVAEVSVLLLTGNKPAGPLRVIERTLTGLQQPRPSPSGSMIAFLRGETLVAAPLDGGTNRVSVAERAESFDWTPDGKMLVYATRVNDKEVSDFYIADIARRSVIDTNGALVAGETLGLSMNVSTFAPRVRCLADGRVLFAGNSLQLPAPTTSASSARFYLIDPALGTNAVPVTIPSQPGTLPQDLAAFVPSRDGRQIAIVESGSDSVAVLDVASGALEVVSPKRGWKSKILPAWRGNDELYFAALPASSTNRPELFRWRKGSAPQVFSHGWTDEAVGGLLEKPSK